MEAWFKVSAAMLSKHRGLVMLKILTVTAATLAMLSAVRGTIDNINEVAGTDIPDVAFRWDASGQQWIFNMATTNLTSGSTDTFRINLTYGYIQFVIGVK